MHHRLLALLAFAGVAAAQSSFVSPVGHDTVEGNSTHSAPFYEPIHYMQIHGDVTGTARVIRGLSFRRDGLVDSDPAYASRTLELEIWLGEGSLASASPTYAANYTAPRQPVYSRKKMVTPSWVQKPATTPAPFDLKFPFDLPATYSGVNDLVWETAVWTNDQTRVHYYADVVATGQRVIGAAHGIDIVSGCQVTSSVKRFYTSSFFESSRNVGDRYRYWAWSSHAPANAPIVFMLGPTNPMIPLPAGICGPKFLYTDAAITFPTTTDANGTANSGTGSNYFPHTLALEGTSAYSQAWALDHSLPNLPIALSSASEATFPALGSGPGRFAWIGSPNAPGAAVSPYGIARGLALVTRFDL